LTLFGRTFDGAEIASLISMILVLVLWISVWRGNRKESRWFKNWKAERKARRDAEIAAEGQLELEGLGGGNRAELDRVLAWAEGTRTGDLAELDPSPPGVVWAAVSVGPTECPGARRCPQGGTCFAEAARAAAAEADLIVVNQHLLGLDLVTDGSILPGKEITIERDGYRIYSGNVADWNFSYDLSGDSLALPSAVDGLAIVSQQTRTPGTAVAEKTGARVDAVLTEIGWPLPQRSISVGQATLDADVVGDSVNALAYLSQVADVSEPGAIFVSKTGAMTFRDRADLQGYTSGITFGPSGIPFTGIGIDFGSESLANAVSVTYTAGTVVAGTAVATDATSQTRYGVVDKTYATLLATAADAQALANWQVALYAEPQYRVDSLTVSLDGITATQAGQVLDLELGDAVQVSWTPNGVGAAVTQIVSIDGIEHQADPAQHLVTFTMSQTLAAFILDDPVFGVLDDDILGF
jgi:hypothetical protein